MSWECADGKHSGETCDDSESFTLVTIVGLLWWGSILSVVGYIACRWYFG